MLTVSKKIKAGIGQPRSVAAQGDPTEWGWAIPAFIFLPGYGTASKEALMQSAGVLGEKTKCPRDGEVGWRFEVMEVV
jgi:hypothetical protein